MRNANATHSIPLGRRSADLYDRAPAQVGHGFRSVKVGTVDGDVTLYIDASRLAMYARKAVASKRGVSKLAGGAFTFQATNRKETRK